MGRTCLIAEADPFIARLLQRFAEESGLRAIHARVGQDVLEMIQQFQPALVILDPELPGKIRGWDIAHSLRSEVVSCTIPLISCSWLTEIEVLALIGEVQGNLQKPDLHYEDFIEALNKAGIDVHCGSEPSQESKTILEKTNEPNLN
jgi:DNA-binding response OmpR family regulator